jgi:hypothetical protein
MRCLIAWPARGAGRTFVVTGFKLLVGIDHLDVLGPGGAREGASTMNVMIGASLLFESTRSAK